LQVELLNTMQLLTAKQCVVLVNLSEEDYVRKKNKWLPKIKEWLSAHAPNDALIPVSVTVEEALASMAAEEQERYCEEKQTQSCLPKVVKAGLKALNMQCFFTAGADEVRSWGIQVSKP
jgi:obg-like ATPase 1